MVLWFCKAHLKSINEKKSVEFFLPFSKLLLRIYVTSERMVRISSVLPFWKPQNVSSNLGYSDLRHAKTRTRDRRLRFFMSRNDSIRFKCEIRGK